MKDVNLKKAVIGLAKVLFSLVVVWLFAHAVSIPFGRAFGLGLTGYLVLNGLVAAAFLAYCVVEHYRPEFRWNYDLTLRSLQRCHALNYSTQVKLHKIRWAIHDAGAAVRRAYLREIDEISECRADINRILGTFPAPLARIQMPSSRRLADQYRAVLEDLDDRSQALYQKAFG